MKKLEPLDPRDKDWLPTGLKFPRWMIEVLDRESCRLHWHSRNRLIIELLRPWAMEQERLEAEAKKKGGAR